MADAAAALGAMVGVDPRDPATAASAGKVLTAYTKFLDPNGLKGARIGVIRPVFAGFRDKTDVVYNAAVDAMRLAGAVIVDPANFRPHDRTGDGLRRRRDHGAELRFSRRTSRSTSTGAAIPPTLSLS